MWMMAISAVKNFSFVSLLRHWQIITIVLLVLLVLYQNMSNTRFLLWVETIPHLENQIEQLNADLTQCVVGNETLVTAIEFQNTEINRWKLISEDMKDDINKLSSKVEKLKAKNNTKVNSILNGATPANCKEAAQYLKSGIGELKWEE